MDSMERFNEYFSFSVEEETELSRTAEEVLELLRQKELTIREALYVINKCEHIIFGEGLSNYLDE